MQIKNSEARLSEVHTLFEQMKARANKWLGQEIPVEFRIDTRAMPLRRNMAYCTNFLYEGKNGNIIICLTPRAIESPNSRVEALFAHELGHAVEYFIGTKELTELSDRLKLNLPRTLERRADRLGEIISKRMIYYLPDCVQTFDSSQNGAPTMRPRPVHFGV